MHSSNTACARQSTNLDVKTSISITLSRVGNPIDVSILLLLQLLPEKLVENLHVSQETKALAKPAAAT
jgi:hypothetical protein